METDTVVVDEQQRKAEIPWVTFVVAEGLPSPDLKALRNHWFEEGALVVNYDLRVFREPSLGRTIIVTPDLPEPERKLLEEQVKQATVPEASERDRCIFVNYHLYVVWR